jgi:hypothetical protein
LRKSAREKLADDVDGRAHGRVLQERTVVILASLFVIYSVVLFVLQPPFYSLLIIIPGLALGVASKGYLQSLRNRSST